MPQSHFTAHINPTPPLTFPVPPPFLCTPASPRAPTPLRAGAGRRIHELRVRIGLAFGRRQKVFQPRPPPPFPPDQLPLLAPRRRHSSTHARPPALPLPAAVRAAGHDSRCEGASVTRSRYRKTPRVRGFRPPPPLFCAAHALAASLQASGESVLGRNEGKRRRWRRGEKIKRTLRSLYPPFRAPTWVRGGAASHSLRRWRGGGGGRECAQKKWKK